MSRADDWGPLLILGGLVLLILALLVVMYLDARAFADECIRAGGYVAGEQTCVKP